MYGGGDGVPDNEDAFPRDPAAYLDTDRDGQPDFLRPGVASTITPALVEDLDDDNDGIPDVIENQRDSDPINPNSLPVKWYVDARPVPPSGLAGSIPVRDGSRDLPFATSRGTRSSAWCPNGLLNAQGQPVQRYLIIGGPANGGPLEKEIVGEKFSLYAWDGVAGSPLKLIDDLSPYTPRPEGVELILVNGEWRVMFVEDRFQATGYATRNVVHWPVSIAEFPPRGRGGSRPRPPL